MIVGDRHVDTFTAVNNRYRLRALAQQMIPPCCRMSNQLVDNQMFLLLTAIRNSQVIHFSERQKIAEEVSQQLDKITGMMDTISDIEDLFLESNINEVFGQIFSKTKTTLSEAQLHSAINALLKGRAV